MIKSTNVSCVVYRIYVQEGVWNRPHFTYKKSKEWTEIQVRSCKNWLKRCTWCAYWIFGQPHVDLTGPWMDRIWWLNKVKFSASVGLRTVAYIWPFLCSVLYFRANKCRRPVCILWRTLTQEPPSNLPRCLQGGRGGKRWTIQHCCLSEKVSGNCCLQGWFKVLTHCAKLLYCVSWRQHW